MLHPIPSRPSADIGQSIVFSTLASGGGPGARIGTPEAPGSFWGAPPRARAPDLSSLGPGGVGDRECQRNRRGWVHVIDRVQSVFRLGGPDDWGTSCLPRNLGRGQNTTLSASGAVGTGLYPTYTWVGLPQGCQSANATSLVCTPLTSGIFSVTASLRDSNAYNVVSATLRLVVSPALKSPTLNASARTVNTGSVLVLTVSVMGGAAPYSYVWSGLPPGCTERSPQRWSRARPLRRCLGNLGDGDRRKRGGERAE